MSKFFSYPGSSPVGDSGGEPLERNPRGSEFYASRRKESHTRSGFTPGEEIYMKGEHAIVLHEEYDAHANQVETWVRHSSQVDSGTKKVVWKAGGNGRQLVVSDVRKVHE